MRLFRLFALLPVGVIISAQQEPPLFRAEDVRPHGAQSPHPLVPGMLSWIFGRNLGRTPGCAAENTMNLATYKTELCGTRVLVGGIEAKLIFASERQINLVLPEHPWENEMVGVQVIRDEVPSAVVSVRFGFNRPMLSLSAPAYAGMPVWVRVEKPWGKGWLRYPFHTEPWDLGASSFEVRFAGAEQPRSPMPFAAGFVGGGIIGLPAEVPEEYLHRVPLHLAYDLSRPGSYEVRFTEYTLRPGTMEKQVYQQSGWTTLQVKPSTAQQRTSWLRSLAQSTPQDTVELLSNYLPSLLAARDEAALRVLARYLDYRDPLVRQYANYALNYFDAGLLERVVPGRKPLRQFVR